MDTKIIAADKLELKPANDNPWYWLATLYGEMRRDWMLDKDIARKNRIAWNRWFAKALSAEQHDELLKKGVSPEELVPWTPTEEAELVIAFTARSGRKDQSLPDPTREIDFSHTIFDRGVFLNGFLFPNEAYFISATFSGYAYFDSATFSQVANFYSATFTEDASFELATFTGNVYFTSATFSKYADFESATFSSTINFINSGFTATTIFADARFNSMVPDFRGAKLHEASEWHGVRWPSAPRDKESAQEQVYAYERLKQEMERLKKHEDEQFFFRKELRARRVLVPLWSVARLLNYLYEALSDYGQSTSKPLLWLCVLFLLVSAVFAWAPCITGTSMTIPDAASLSFASIFAIFPLPKGIMAPDVFATLSSLAKIILVVEAFFGTLLLFLLGVALRNRFRMR